LSLPDSAGCERGAPLSYDEASRTAKKQTTVRAMAKSSPGIAWTLGDKLIGFSFYMKVGCSEASSVKVGSECSRGFHICCVPDCGSHSSHGHRGHSDNDGVHGRSTPADRGILDEVRNVVHSS
jgi:hypothetical protein